MDRLRPKDLGKVLTVALILLSTACVDGSGGDGNQNNNTSADTTSSTSMQLVCQSDPGETYVSTSQNLKEGDSISVQNGSKTVISARSIGNNQTAVRYETCVYQ